MSDSPKLAVMMVYEPELLDSTTEPNDYMAQQQRMLVVPQHTTLAKLVALGMDHAPLNKRGRFYKLVRIDIDIETEVIIPEKV